MSKEQERSPEDEGFDEFVHDMIRRPKTGSYELLLCQHLIKSVAAEAMEKIRLITEGAYMVPDTPVDKEALEVIHSLATSFITMKVIYDTDLTLYWGRIPWNFPDSEENYKKYIEPWFLDPYKLTRILDRDTPEKKHDELWKNFFLYTVEGRLYPSSLEYLKSAFISWAMPKVMTMFEQLTLLISPNIYLEMLNKVST